MSRETASFLHASQRLMERYGVWLPERAYEELCERLSERREVITPVQWGREVVRVRIEGVQTYCIYCPATRRVLTFLAPSMYAVPNPGRHAADRRKHERRPQPYKRRGKQRRDEA